MPTISQSIPITFVTLHSNDSHVLPVPFGVDLEGKFREYKLTLRQSNIKAAEVQLDVSTSHTHFVCIATRWYPSNKIFTQSNFLCVYVPFIFW